MLKRTIPTTDSRRGFLTTAATLQREAVEE